MDALNRFLEACKKYLRLGVVICKNLWNQLKEAAAAAPDHTAEFDQADIEKNKGISVCAYLSWLVLIPLLVGKKSPYARFHANQGIVFAIVETLIGLVLGCLGHIVLIGFIFRLISDVVGVLTLIAVIYSIKNVSNGLAKELPFFGDIRILK